MRYDTRRARQLHPAAFPLYIVNEQDATLSKFRDDQRTRLAREDDQTPSVI